MASLDLTSVAEALKIKYTSKELKLRMYKQSPTFALLPKEQDFGGEAYHVPQYFSTAQGVGSTLATARTADSGPELAKFIISSRKKKYAIYTLDAETLYATKQDADSFLKSQTMLFNQKLGSVGRDFSMDLFRASGSRGVIATSGVSGDTITLASAQDIVNFEVGQLLNFSSAQVGGTVRNGGTATRVTAVNRAQSSATITVADATGAADGDHIFRASFHDTTANGKVWTGFDAWLPSTVTSTAFHGVDRTVDATRLGGLRYNGSGQTIEDAILTAAAYCGQEGATPDFVVMNPIHQVELVKSLGAKATYTPTRDADGIVGFDLLTVRTAVGDLKVMTDPHCPAGTAYMLDMSTWALKYLGPDLLHTINEDGNTLRHLRTEDTLEVMYRSMGEIVCYNPGGNLRLTLDV
jgi:hypothetical protein